MTPAVVEVVDGEGRSFLVDLDDLPLVLGGTNVYVRSDGYVSITHEGVKTLLHRVILGLTDGHVHADHINRVRSDNRRLNLREATLAENNRNGARRRNNTSGYKGVAFDRRKHRWQAGIGLNGARKALGRFLSKEDAARAYDRAAIEHYGEFAVTNFPREDYT